MQENPFPRAFWVFNLASISLTYFRRTVICCWKILFFLRVFANDYFCCSVSSLDNGLLRAKINKKSRIRVFHLRSIYLEGLKLLTFSTVPSELGLILISAARGHGCWICTLANLSCIIPSIISISRLLWMEGRFVELTMADNHWVNSCFSESWLAKLCFLPWAYFSIKCVLFSCVLWEDLFGYISFVHV